MLGLNRYEETCSELYPDIIVLEPNNLHKKTGWWGTFEIDDGQPYIFIEPMQSATDKYQVLKEEFYHVLTAVSILLERPNMNYYQRLSVRKQELIARHLAYKDIITLDDLIKCWQDGLIYEWEIANQLDVTPEFLHNAIQYLKSVYPTRFIAETTSGIYRIVINATFNFYLLDAKLTA
nr:MAG TPA: IrrE protein [Caudoviricetes sp.]